MLRRLWFRPASRCTCGTLRDAALLTEESPFLSFPWTHEAGDMAPRVHVVSCASARPCLRLLLRRPPRCIVLVTNRTVDCHSKTLLSSSSLREVCVEAKARRRADSRPNASRAHGGRASLGAVATVERDGEAVLGLATVRWWWWWWEAAAEARAAAAQRGRGARAGRKAAIPDTSSSCSCS